jgi:hypothetical protein
MAVEFLGGGFSSTHDHGSAAVFVLPGTIHSRIEGGPEIVYTEGRTFFEPLEVVDLLPDYTSATETSRIVADKGTTLTSYHG